MNYLKSYMALMRKAQKRNWGKKTSPCYVEKHHIFPVSIFGPNSKIVCLTAREHYVAHLLLWKGLQKRYGDKSQKTIKMSYASWRMCFIQKDGEQQKINSVIYESIKKKISSQRSQATKELMLNPEYKRNATRGIIFSAKTNPNQLGKPLTKITKQRISESTRGEKHHMWGKVGHRKGMKNGPEHRAKISASRRRKLGNIWEVVDPGGNKYTCESLKEFCKKYNLSSGHMYSVANGRLKQHKGWLVRNTKGGMV